MKEHPILFSTPMVKAILEGRKTMTRRVVKPIPPDWIEQFGYDCFCPTPEYIAGRGRFEGNIGENFYKCPYGQVGDRLWVRETFQLDEITCKPLYKADYIDCKLNWRPSIHMPRWASRITLEITNIRVERLQEITGNDVIAEGIRLPVPVNCTQDEMLIAAFHALWDSINGKNYPWSINPWVWVLEFKLMSKYIANLQ